MSIFPEFVHIVVSLIETEIQRMRALREKAKILIALITFMRASVTTIARGVSTIARAVHAALFLVKSKSIWDARAVARRTPRNKGRMEKMSKRPKSRDHFLIPLITKPLIP